MGTFPWSYIHVTPGENTKSVIDTNQKDMEKIL